ncbi:hypothetical protein [Kitasatospora griseola]|uniref:hypothetical protein n=1 Tax=Kitasatospora griseola TaxID=2064 RepID=UPI00166FF5B9|nr:hypothetical protein [Kitasatospora griseola]GGR09553.1 hypothetical protein GCM10010195_74860 [Kitasatospora griseola]
MPDNTAAQQTTENSKGPAPITVPPGAFATADLPPETPAAAEARDRLLNAIGQQAQSVAGLDPEQAAKVLGELARSYALVTRTRFYQPVDFLWQPTLFQPVGGMDQVQQAFAPGTAQLG